MIVKLPINKIIIPQGLLPRIFGVNEEKVEEYAEAMENGAEFPPIKVWEKLDGTYQVIDGVHRISAYRKLGKEYIEAEIIHGIEDEVDFMEWAIRENLKHGLPLSREDKKEDARRLYIKGRKPEDIANLFKVSERTVYNWIGDLKQEEKLEKEKLKQKALELKEQGLTVREIAKEIGVDHSTIVKWFGEKLKNFKNSPTTPEDEYDDNKSQFIQSLEEKKQKAIQLHNQGYEVEDIAQELGVNEITVSRWIKEEEGGIYTTLEAADEYEDIPSHYKLLDPDQVAREVMAGYEDEEEEQEEQPKKRNQPNVGRPREKCFDALEELETYANEMQALTWRIVSKFGHDKAIDILNQLLDQVEKNIFEDIKVSL